MKYIELNGLKLYLPSSVSVKKGKSPYDYCSNWSRLRNGANLLGKEYRFIKGTPEHTMVRDLVGEKYGKVAKPCANADCKLIDEERAMDYLNTPTPNCKITGVKNGKGNLTLVDPEEVRVCSKEAAQALGIQHRNLIQTINKYKVKLENQFGIFLFKTEKIEDSGRGRPETNYYLTREQCEALATLSRNTEQVVDFKLWIVKKFNELKGTKVFTPEFQAFGTCISNRGESMVQQMFVQLASYTDNPLRQEVVINDKHFRVDLMSADNTLAIELKNKLITPVDVKRTIFEKNYYHSIKKKFPSFQTLIFSSTVGINEEAREMIKHNNPYIIYQSIPELANRFIKDSNKRELADKFQYLLQAA